MKNKRNTYLLLALVLGIWGVIVYQFFNFSNNSNQEVITQSSLLIPDITYVEPNVTLINTDYRDPFSGELMKTAEKNESQILSIDNNYHVEKEEIRETIIKYKGIVSDLNDKVKVFMIIIDGGTYLMKQGNVEQEVKLIKGNRQNITIKHKGKLKTILIEE